MLNIYKGRIRNINESYIYGDSAVVGFISTEGDTKGLSILIKYEIAEENLREIFTKDLENRLRKNNVGVLAEVSLTELISRDVIQYKGKGPIKFLED